jgi:hypothetical protein
VGPLQHRWLIRLGLVLVEARAGDHDRKYPLLGDSGRNSLFRIQSHTEALRLALPRANRSLLDSCGYRVVGRHPPLKDTRCWSRRFHYLRIAGPPRLVGEMAMLRQSGTIASAVALAVSVDSPAGT